ncbi:hypothetical protein FOL47_010406 [Perkinsus chesapeaki]|uniref:Uncharacterized protein n=1 Tax=Perkinsus chesapeaki TaxID=330153 RepID=A0A7J6MPS3_PERCH|nr:hypothetical protein FOL47_010406 [Perkinsus chesapeaki]
MVAVCCLVGYTTARLVGVESCDSSSYQHYQLQCDVTVDGLANSMWSSDISQDSTGNAWIRWTFTEPLQIDSYMIQACTTSPSTVNGMEEFDGDSCAQQQSPLSWILKGGLQLSTLAELDRRERQTAWKGSERRVFGLEQPVTVRHLRLELAESSGEFGQFSIAEFDAFSPMEVSIHVGTWSNCSEICGGGIRRRPVECHGDDDRTDYPLARCAFSLGVPPTSSEPCNTQPCPLVTIVNMNATAVPSEPTHLSLRIEPSGEMTIYCLVEEGEWLEQQQPTYTFDHMVDFGQEISCVLPSCEFVFDGLSPNTTYNITCAFAEDGEDAWGIKSIAELVSTGQGDVTFVEVTDYDATTLNITVGIDVVGTAQKPTTVRCEVFQATVEDPLEVSSNNTYVTSSTPTVSSEVSTLEAACDGNRTCDLVATGLQSGSLYNVTCWTSPNGKPVSVTEPARTRPAVILDAKHLETIMQPEPGAVLSIAMTSKSYVACHGTPTKELVCCPSSPSYETMRSMPWVPCASRCDITIMGLRQGERYAFWCSGMPILSSLQYEYFPSDDFGIRLTIPQQQLLTTLSPPGTAPPSISTQFQENRNEIKKELITDGDVESAIRLCIIIVLGICLMCCLCVPLFRKHSLMDGTHISTGSLTGKGKLLLMEVIIIATAVSQVGSVIFYHHHRTGWTKLVQSLALTVAISMALLVWQMGVAGIFHFFFGGRQRRGTHRYVGQMDAQRLGVIFLPPLSLVAINSCSAEEADTAYSVKLFYMKLDTLVGVTPYVSVLVALLIDTAVSDNVEPSGPLWIPLACLATALVRSNMCSYASLSRTQ